MSDEYVIPVYVRDHGSGERIQVGMATEESSPGVRRIQLADNASSRDLSELVFGDEFPGASGDDLPTPVVEVAPEDDTPTPVVEVEPEQPIEAATRKSDRLGK